VASKPAAPPPKAPPPPHKAPPPPPPKAPPLKPEKVAKAAPEGAAAQGPVAAPLLIYVADLQVQVFQDEMAATLDKVIDVAESFGGYLAGRKDTSVQVRIPSYKFREGLTQIEKLAEVLHRSVTADDVSEQYSDLEIRLVNLKATRQRLHEFMARAANMQDMLTVEQQLERVAGEIEQIEGKMRFLRSRAAFSLITVNIQPKPKQEVKIADKEPPPPPPREVTLPIEWIKRVGVLRLLDLNSR
jgi:hypothetical protein